MKIPQSVKDIFYLDLRSLALLRICIGSLIIIDLIDRASDIGTMYTDVGLLTRSQWYEIQPQFPWIFSLHMISGSYDGQVFLFIIAGIFATMVLIGYRTTLATIVSFIFLISLQNRNLLITSSADTLFRLILFWAIFLPWHARFSLDALFSKKATLPIRFVSAGTIAYILQIIFVYVFTVLLKSSPAWRTEGTAIYYALSLEMYRMPLGYTLYTIPSLLRPLTYAVFFLESFGTLLLFIPYKKDLFRFLAVLAFVSLHLGIGLTLRVGIFPLVCVFAWFAFLPTSFWDIVVKKFEKTKIVLFFLKKQNKFENTHLPAFNPRLSYTSPFLAGIIIFFLIYVFFWNITTLPGFEKRMPSSIYPLGRVLKLNQKWDMFSPAPPKNTEWLLVPARLYDNTLVDLQTNGKPVSFRKPENFSTLYKNARTQKFLSIMLSQNTSYRSYYAQYLCNSWNTTHKKNQQIKELTILSMKIVTLPDYAHTSPEKKNLYSTTCK